MVDLSLIKSLEASRSRLLESIYQSELEKLIVGICKLKNVIKERGDLQALESLEWLKDVAIDGVVARDMGRKRKIV